MLETLTTWLLLLASLTGLYVHVSESWTLPYRLNLIAHPVLGFMMGALLIPYTIRHIREKGLAFKRRKDFLRIPFAVLEAQRRGRRNDPTELPLVAPGAQRRGRIVRIGGWLSMAGFIAVVLTALPLLKGAAHDLNRIYLHRYVGYAVAGLLFLHLTPRMVRELRGLSWNGGLPSALRSSRAGATVAALVMLSLGAVAALPPKRESNTVEFHAMLSAPPPQRIASNALSMTSSCGSAAACHEGLTKEYEHSAHPLAPETSHFRKITGLLAEERGADDVRFCTSCHSPATALSPGDVRPPEAGFGCLVCHSQSASHLVPFDAAGVARPLRSAPGTARGIPMEPARRDHEGYTVTLNQDHLSMFPADGKSRLDRFNEYLIKLNPIGHGRVFRPENLDRDNLCLACHQEHIPAQTEGQFLRPRCIDCHMKLQENLSESGSDRPHLFVGANTVLPRLRGDSEMEKKVQAWLTGYFKTDVLDSFWELRSEKYEQPSKAVWIVMTLEPTEAGMEGQALPVKVYTSNVGIGHPFPTGVIDLYDIWLEIRAADGKGREIFASGRAGGIAHKEDGIHRLGGFFTDAEGAPIDRHRIWVKEKAVRRWVEVGRTVEDLFEIPIPRGAGQSVIVSARWMYQRLNAPFLAWAYGPTPPDLPVVEMASVTQTIPIGAPRARR